MLYQKPYRRFFYIYIVHFQKAVPNAKIGFSKAMSAGWIYIDKAADGGPMVFRKVCLNVTTLLDIFLKNILCYFSLYVFTIVTVIDC